MSLKARWRASSERGDRSMRWFEVTRLGPHSGAFVKAHRDVHRHPGRNCYFGGLSIRTANQGEAAALLAGVRSGDEAAFAALTEPYRRQLHLHCYRMLGSFDEAEDLVQETLLRAWRGRAGFEGRSMVRTWLYRIATNACLDLLASRSRRLLSLVSPHAAESYTVDWLQPYPDLA